VSVNQLAGNVKTAAPADPYHAGRGERVDMFTVGDQVERREWIGMTKATVAVEWQVGFRLAGTRTTERADDLRKSV
jgi:hypothetical protein